MIYYNIKDAEMFSANPGLRKMEGNYVS